MTIVLQQLTLTAYRGVSNLTLEGLTPVSLVVGANNAGKTSLLEAAGLLLRPPDPAQWISAVRQRDFDMSLVEGLWSLFPGSEALHPEDGPQQSHPLIVEGITSGGPRKIEASCSASLTVRASESADLSARIAVSVDGEPSLTLKFPLPLTVAHEVPTYRVLAVTPGTHYSTRALVELLSRVVDEGKKQLAVQLLQVFDPLVEDLDISASFGREAVRVTHKTRGVVDLASFGDGMRRAATMALALSRATQGVLLIDEIEAGIHPTVLRQVLAKLVEAATTSQVQIIATTHSLEALDAVISSIEDRDELQNLTTFHVRRKTTNKHEVIRYTGSKLLRLREGGLDIR